MNSVSTSKAQEDKQKYKIQHKIQEGKLTHQQEMENISSAFLKHDQIAQWRQFLIVPVCNCSR